MATLAAARVIDQDYPDTPEGRASRWTKEFTAAKKNVEEWQDRSEKIIARYVDDRTDDSGTTRLNLFTANTQTMESLLFGKTPKVDVTRRFADSADDEARVAAEMLERMLNTDIERDSDTQQEAMRNALADRLRPGLGVNRLRYVVSMKTQPETPAITGPDGVTELAPAIPEQEAKDIDTEDVAIDYVYWKDNLWSPCRTHSELRWWAFGNDMSKGELVKRFGKELADQLPMAAPEQETGDDATTYQDPRARCCVWEIWDKENKCVDWYVEGHPASLDHKDDTLGLDGFWPFPRPMFANLTTSKLLPTPDFVLAEDLYDEIDEISSRITLLEECIVVRGAYDKNNPAIKDILKNTGENSLVAVDSWAPFAEKGGLAGAIDWMPVDMVVNALNVLREYRTELIGLLFQVTGMSDIMRGQASQQTTATEQAIKARFASVRVQTMQDEFARFASDAQRIKAEIISKHFDPETILRRSNVMRTPDATLAQRAVQLIKSKFYDYRISVNPDSVSLTDFAGLKQERFEFAQTLSQYFQGMMPLIQLSAGQPGAIAPTVQFIMELGQTLVAGLKGGSEMEGIFDQYIAGLKQVAQQAAMQPPAPPQPNPQLQVAQVKAGAEQFKAKADMQSTGMDLQVARERHAMEMQKIGASMQSEEQRQRTEALKQVAAVTGGAANDDEEKP